MKKLVILSVLLGCLLAPSSVLAAPYKNLLSIDFAALPAPSAAVVSDSNAAGPINLSDQDNQGDTNAFAAGLVFAKTGDTAARNRVCTAMSNAQGTQSGARALALGRNVQGLAYAWDLIGGPNSGCANAASLHTFLLGLRTAPTTSGPSNITTCHNLRPNNWGTHCGASRIALDRLANDTADLNVAANVFHGYVGDRASYSGHDFTSPAETWDCNVTLTTVHGITPPGCTKSGVNLDGAVPDDSRRCAAFSAPPCFSNYVRESHQGSIAQALMLKGAGFDSLAWNTSAMKRVMDFVYRTTFADGRHVYDGDDSWIPFVVNKLYGTSYSSSGDSVGKGLGYAGYWAAGITLGGSPPPPPAQCADTIDNDLDGQIDFPNDPGCTSATDDDETNAPPPGDTTPPSVPANVVKLASTQTSINVGWNASTDNVGVDHYVLTRNGVTVASPTTTSFNDTGRTCGTSYSYTVKAVDAANNESAASGAVSLSTDACPADTTPPSTPTGLATSSTTQTDTSLSWTASTDNVGVHHYIVDKNGTQVALVAGTGQFIDGLTCATTYTLGVTAVDAANNQSARATTQVTTLACPPPPGGGTETLTAIADTYVDAGVSTSNFGTASLLKLDGDPQRRPFFRFAGRQAGTVTDLKLKIWSDVTSSQAIEVRTCANPEDDAWTETGLTYSNMACTGVPLSSPVITFTVVAGLNTIDLPNSTVDVAGNPTTIILRKDVTSTSLVQINSREAASNKPQLVITY